jgi:type IV fimbrial biogenesis protein FimT
MNPGTPLRRQAGLTLVELMITIVVLAILTAVALPNFRDFLRRNAVAGHSNELLGDLRLARETAATRNVIVSICASNNVDDEKPACSGGNQFDQGWLVYISPKTATAFAATDELLKVNQGARNVSVRSGAVQIASFDQRGSSVGGITTFRICAKATGDAIGASHPRSEGRVIDVQSSGRAGIVPLGSATDDSTAQGFCTPA